MIPLQYTYYTGPLQIYVPVISAITTLFIFVLVFAALYLIGKPMATKTVRQSLKRKGFDETIIGLGESVTAAIAGVLAIAIAATVAGFGVVLAAFATLGGALALAIGFGAQDLVANFVAGVFIIHDEPFKSGDWIEWSGNSGKVREIGLRVTKLDTFDNELITVPNNDLTNSVVINNEANDQRRVSVDFGIGYGDDIEQAREAIIEEGSQIDGVLSDPEPSAPVTSLGDSDVVLSGRIWIKPQETSYGAVRAKFIERVKQRFDAEGIDIPYPNTQVTGDIEVRNVEEPSTAD